MKPRLKSWLFALGFFLGAKTIHASECGPKISSKLCAQLSSSSDSLFKVRIVLDASKEGPFSKSEKRPLLVWTEHLLENHKLFSIIIPESAYKPLIISNSPSIESVVYHNVSVAKSELENITNEQYVKVMEQGCNNKISHYLCTDLNGFADTSRISFRAYFQDSLESDSAKLVTYVSKRTVYHPKFPDSLLPVGSLAEFKQYGYSSSVSDLKAMSWDDEVRILEQWYEPKTVSARRKGDARILTQGRPESAYQLNGRQIGKKEGTGLKIKIHKVYFGNGK